VLENVSDKLGHPEKNSQLIFLSSKAKSESFAKYFSSFFWLAYSCYTGSDRWKVTTIFYCRIEYMFSCSEYTVLSTVFQGSKCKFVLPLPYFKSAKRGRKSKNIFIGGQD
jgi:hypothetical protein